MRAVAACLAALALAVAYGLPWGEWLGLFPAHMIRHMTLVAVAAPLLVLSLGPRLPAPSVLLAAVAEFVVVWGWHAPAMHHLADGSALWFALEQASFLAAGLAIWAGALRAGEALAGAGGLLLTTMHMTLLGALITLAPQPIYAHGASLPAQQLGGLLMLAIGTPIYLLAGLWLTARALGPDPKEGFA